MRQLNGVYTQRFNRWLDGYGSIREPLQGDYHAEGIVPLELARSLLQQRPLLHKSGQGGSAALSASGKVSSQA